MHIYVTMSTKENKAIDLRGGGKGFGGVGRREHVRSWREGKEGRSDLIVYFFKKNKKINTLGEVSSSPCAISFIAHLSRSTMAKSKSSIYKSIMEWLTPSSG